MSISSFSILEYVVYALVIVGALHLGVIGIFGIDLFATLLGEGTMVARVVFSAIGVAALYLLFTLIKPGKAAA